MKTDTCRVHGTYHFLPRVFSARDGHTVRPVQTDVNVTQVV